MDTPCQPRRKLKRVLKKVPKSSTKKVSQKRLKAAINTSLNSTNSLRTLKTNNSALALRLENVKEELKATKDDKSDLLEENYALREKVNSLEQMLLEGVGQKKDHVDIEGIRKIITSLNTHMSDFCVDLEQLAQICFPRALSLESQCSLDTRQRSASGDSGDCGFQPESPGILTSTEPNSLAGGDMSITDERSSIETSFEQQYTSSVNKMKDIERRVHMKNELPRRIRRSFNCPEEDEDACVDFTALEHSTISDKTANEGSVPLNDDPFSGFDIIEHSPFCSAISEELLHEQPAINNKKKSASLTRSKKRKQPAALHIANEFMLNAAHMNIMTKYKENDLSGMVAEDVQQTIHIPADMDLTMPIDTTVLAVTNNNEHFETFRESLSAIKPRRLTRTLPEHSDDQTSSQSSDELVPDAVTMKKMKPGQFKFSVGRKNSEGCRKEIVDFPRARSKSKKRIAELVEQLPQEEPKSIFDFHEKTPKFSPENAEEALSVYSLADESAMSPCAPLKKDKVTRRTSSSVDVDKEIVSNLIESGSSAEHSEPLNESSSNMPRKTSRLSRSRSRRTTKNTKRPSFVDHQLVSDSETPEPEIIKGLTLIVGETYSEPLKDSPNNGSKRDSRISRSRSRRRTKPLIGTNKEYLSDAEASNQDGDTNGCPMVNETTHLEVLNGSLSEMPIRLSKVSRSRSRRRNRKSDVPSAPKDINHDENTESLNSEHNDLNDISEVLLDKMSNNVFKAAGSRSQKAIKSKEIPPEFDNEEVLTLEAEYFNECGNKVSLLGEGSTYSVALKDSPSKTPRVNRRSRSQAARLTRSTGRSLKTDKSGKADSDKRYPCSEIESDSDDGHREGGKVSSLLGEGTTYSVPLKGSPARSPEICKKSKSHTARLTRSTGRSLKSNKDSAFDCNARSPSPNKTSCLEPESDKLNEGHSSLNTNISERLKEQSFEIMNADQNTDIESNGNVFESQFSSNPEIATVNTRRKKSNKSRRLKTTENNDSSLLTSQESTFDDDSGEYSKSNMTKEFQTLSEPKNIKAKRGRPRKLKNQEMLDICGSDSIDSRLKTTEDNDSSLLTSQENIFDGDSGEYSKANMTKEFQTLSEPKNIKAKRGRPRKLKNQEMLDICGSDSIDSRLKTTENNDSSLLTSQENTFDGDSGEYSKSNMTKEFQTISEPKNIKAKRGRPWKLKNQEMLDICGSDSIDSNEELDSVSHSEGEETNTSIDHQDGPIELCQNDRSDCVLPEEIEPCAIPENVTVTENVACVNNSADNDVQKSPSSNSFIKSVPRSRKRKIKDDLCEDENKCKDKSTLEQGSNKQYGDTESTKSCRQDKELTNSISSVPRITSPCEKDQSVQKSIKVSINQKISSPHSSKPPKHEESTLKDGTNQRKYPALLKIASSPLTPLKHDSSDFQPGRHRRNKQIVSYAEPSLNKKLRRGDPFTAAHGSVQVFKSPKLQGKKSSNRNVLESLQNLNVTSTTIME